MEKECAICGDAPTQKNPIETLRENRIGVQGFHEEIRLCKACLGRREAKSWNAAGTQGRRLQDALEAQSEPPQGHYTFLQDDQKIHLVRLRPTWLAEHAAAVTS
ncbi:MAG: hypothetical protein HYT80_05165 [Euryarchaeota archaeon]|nr:hypothetical protein [Euryarchaeota archaeon]